MADDRDEALCAQGDQAMGLPEGMIELLATVVQGLEFVAQNEVEDKLGVISSKAYLGAIRFAVRLDQIPEVLKLRSIDNISAIIYEKKAKGLCADPKEVALQKISSVVPAVDWTLGLRAWQLARGDTLAGGEEKIEKQLAAYEANEETAERNPEISFRVTCNRAGDKSRHKFASTDGACALGGAINRAFGWKVKMKEMQLNVLLNIRSEWITVAIALNEDTLFKRNLVAFGPTSLRATIAYALVALVNPKPGELVVDALCGGGSIPLEGAQSLNTAFWLAGDNHPEAMKHSHENFKFNEAKLLAPLELVRWDATQLPLKDNAVDAMVTDLPFGKKIGSKQDNRELYPKLLSEWSRVMAQKGRLVALTQDKRNLEAAVMTSGVWRVHNTFDMNIGGLQAVVALLINDKP